MCVCVCVCVRESVSDECSKYRKVQRLKLTLFLGDEREGGAVCVCVRAKEVECVRAVRVCVSVCAMRQRRSANTSNETEAKHVCKRRGVCVFARYVCVE